MPIASNVRPTRMEYLRTIRRIAISRKGLKLLKLKRSALIFEFFQCLFYQHAYMRFIIYY